MNYIFKILPVLFFVLLFCVLLICTWNILAPASLTWLGEAEKGIGMGASTIGLVILLATADELRK